MSTLQARRDSIARSVERIAKSRALLALEEERLRAVAASPTSRPTEADALAADRLAIEAEEALYEYRDRAYDAAIVAIAAGPFGSADNDYYASIRPASWAALAAVARTPGPDAPSQAAIEAARELAEAGQ